MRVVPVDPRLDAEWDAGPVRKYRVVLWISRSHSDEYDLLGVDDVHAAIAWADVEARSRDCNYALYAKVGRDGPGLVWLAGIDPTIGSERNFERSHPLG